MLSTRRRGGSCIALRSKVTALIDLVFAPARRNALGKMRSRRMQKYDRNSRELAAGEGSMRRLAWLPFLLTFAACSSNSEDSSKLTLRNTVWEHVNVQVVITKG